MQYFQKKENHVCPGGLFHRLPKAPSDKRTDICEECVNGWEIILYNQSKAAPMELPVGIRFAAGDFLSCFGKKGSKEPTQGAARAPARDAFPLGIPQPVVCLRVKMFRPFSGRPMGAPTLDTETGSV